MAGHTMTLIDRTKIYIVGGFSASNYFTEHTYEYDTSNNKWRKLELSGSKPTGRGISSGLVLLRIYLSVDQLSPVNISAIIYMKERKKIFTSTL